MRKVLIITYYWAPAGGPGVQRWLKFVKYLRDFNIEPIVYIPENPTYPIIDNEIGNDLPTDIEIIKHPIWEPYKWASLFSKKKTKKISAGIIPRKQVSLLDKLLLWVRGNLFIPDARKFWVKPSVRYLTSYIKNNGIDTIITTSPPHSVHLIGYHLRKQFPNLKWISDFRDPWTTIGYYKDLLLTHWADKRQHYWEKEVLQTADLVLVTSFKTQRDFKSLTNKQVEVITNGYDDDLPAETPSLSPYFLLSHIGSLLSERNPEPLWQVLSEMTQEQADFRRDLRLCLAGKVSDEVLNSLQKWQLTEFLDLKGYISHTEALALQRQSQLLLLLEINHPKTEGIIPGKLFEYMASQRPILALGYQNWDVKDIITQTHTGLTLSLTDTQGIKQALTHYYDLYKANNLHTQPTSLGAYHRKALTQKLSEVILEK